MDFDGDEEYGGEEERLTKTHILVSASISHYKTNTDYEVDFYDKEETEERRSVDQCKDT